MFKLIIPLTYTELYRLQDISRLWEVTILPNELKLIESIVFSFDNIRVGNSQECKDVCVSLFKKFGKVEIFNSNISDSENIYVRDIALAPKSIEMPRLGYKSGPNTQFFRTIRENLSHNLFSWAFYCETDCYPLKSKWISRLYQACLSNRNALILGSLYHGTARLGEEINYHINGNALYNLSKYSQAELLYDVLEKFILLEVADSNHNIAYDVAIETLKHKITSKSSRNKLLRHLQLTDQVVRSLASKVRPTDLIVNKAGSDELQSITLPTLKDALELVSNGTYLVHSRKYLKSVKDLLLTSDNTASPKVYKESVDNLLTKIRANQNTDFSVSWSFLLHEELMQECISNNYCLKGYLCNTTYSNQVSPEAEFIHVRSKLLADCFDAESSISVVVASLFCKRDTNNYFLLVSSGTSHQRVFIDLQTHSVWFSQLKWQENIIRNIQRYGPALRSLLEIQKALISKISCCCVSILPLSTRPFLAVNDYSVFIKRLIDKKKHITIFDIGRYTFLNYDEPTLLESKYISKRQATSIQHINNHIHGSNSWLVVPRSISYKESNPFSWLHQIKKSLPNDASDNSLKIFNAINCANLLKYTNYLEVKKYHFAFLIDIAREKRYCQNLVCNFTSFLRMLALDYDSRKEISVCILLDGHTMSDSVNCDSPLYRNSLTDIVEFGNAFDLSPHELPFSVVIFALHGLSINQKVRVIPSNSIGICQMGTASLLYSYVYNLKTLIIGPTSVLDKPSPAFYDDRNSCIVNSSDSIVINSDLSKSWDRQRYDIVALDTKLIRFVQGLRYHEKP